jgi:pimeloyl-ACP methyl ester carboxylesterase
MKQKGNYLTLLGVFIALLLPACSQAAIEVTSGPDVQPVEKVVKESNAELDDQSSGKSSPELTATEQPFIPVFEEADCHFEVPEGAAVSCGFVVVPEDHFNDLGETLQIAVVVVKDESPDHQPDPVILLAGGPGEKTVANARQMASLLTPLHPNRDLILFDQRGVGLSEPALECPDWEEAQYEVLDEPDVEVALQTTFEALMLCRDQLLDEGYNLEAYTTQQNAADVNAIRIALGYEQLNLYGGSYGSHLAQAVMRDFPEGIRSVVLTSVYPLESSLFIDATTSTANALMYVVERCTADEACSQAYPDLERVLFEVVERLNAEPLEITLTDALSGEEHEAVLTGDAAFSHLAGLLYQTQLIPAIPQAIYDVYNGDYALMTQLRSINLVFIKALSRGMQFSVLCTDDLVGKTPEDLLAAREELPAVLNKSVDPEALIEYSIFGICENWPVEESDAWVKEPVVSDLPTLILAGEFDPVTPPEYGQLVASHLSQGFFFEVPGIGHDITGASACTREMAGAFLNEPGQAPDAGCIEETPALEFDIHTTKAELILEPFSDEGRGFSGLVPVGWQELAPGNLLRGSSSLDPTYFVLEASPGTAADLLAELTGQLGIEGMMESQATEELGSFTWTFYTFERGGNYVDLALAEDAKKAYFVFLVSAVEERDDLYEQLFIPAVEAMVPLG